MLNIFGRVRCSSPACFVLRVKVAEIKKEMICSSSLGNTSKLKGSEVEIWQETHVAALGL